MCKFNYSIKLLIPDKHMCKIINTTIIVLKLFLNWKTNFYLGSTFFKINIVTAIKIENKVHDIIM